MSTYYNPRIVINGLILYFDAQNIKSYSGDGSWKSLISNDQISVPTTISNGYISQDNARNGTVNINNFDSNSSVSIVVSTKPTDQSRGAFFSIYGDSNYQNAGSTPTTSIKRSFNVTTSSSSNVMYSYSNTTVTSSIKRSFNVTTSSSSVVSYNYNVSNSIISTSNVHVTSSTSQEIYNDCPAKAITAFIDNNNINTRFKVDGYDLVVGQNFTLSDNDVFTFVFKKSTNDYNVKIYQNLDLLTQSGNISQLSSFGTSLSVLSLNAQGNSLNIPVRLIAIYNRELSALEIQQTTSAIRQV